MVRGDTVTNDLDALDQPEHTARKAFDAPSSQGEVVPGDVIALSYRGIGTLRNEVVAVVGN